ncbi:hypothetical protein KP509_03G073800 [Ceratopteris richardii]|uniref:Uncharacterized protein n=1 Tax=Ceratopteris richardii TaxID=49495 RepID=A0A8T2V550_CERRI|nr:hypothetical protein KP509_03G073800 [Ceratopteris richardii]
MSSLCLSPRTLLCACQKLELSVSDEQSPSFPMLKSRIAVARTSPRGPPQFTPAPQPFPRARIPLFNPPFGLQSRALCPRCQQCRPLFQFPLSVSLVRPASKTACPPLLCARQSHSRKKRIRPQ